MATAAAPVLPDAQPKRSAFEPLLEAGDRLTRNEFERRYTRMAGAKKAELIEGIVYMPSPVPVQKHSRPHAQIGTWLGLYASETPGVESLDNATVGLDLDNEPQPDLLMIKAPEKGGQARIPQDDYLEGAPELVVEIVGSSQAYDLHQKKGAYRRNAIREYLAWITGEERIVWWELREGDYHEIAADAHGVLKSGIFPGLWLDTPALLRGDMKAVLETLWRGIESSEHRSFIT